MSANTSSGSFSPGSAMVWLRVWDSAAPNCLGLERQRESLLRKIEVLRKQGSPV
jgi:hypothetical protein